MSRYVSPAWRNFIANRAHHLCEYCLSFEGFSVVKFQVEHIISIKRLMERQALQEVGFFPHPNALQIIS